MIWLLPLGLLASALAKPLSPPQVPAPPQETRRPLPPDRTDLFKTYNPSFGYPVNVNRTEKTRVIYGRHYGWPQLEPPYIKAAIDFLEEYIPGLQLKVEDNSYLSESTNTARIFFNQRLNGLSIDGTDVRVWVDGADNSITDWGDMAYFGALPEGDPLKDGGYIDPIKALKSANRKLRLELDTSEAYVEAVEGPEPEQYMIKNVPGCTRPAEARLVYCIQNGEIFLTWKIQTDVGDDFVTTWVNAWDAHHIVTAMGGIHSLLKPTHAEFLVFPWEMESPNDGSQEMVSSPWEFWNSTALFPWIADSTNVYNTTIGNNVVAQIRPWRTSPDGFRPISTNHSFTYRFDPSLPPEQQRELAVTQAFYVANMYHDLLYHLGFQEKDGNFQTDNGDQKGVGNDAIYVDVQGRWMTNNGWFNCETTVDGDKCHITLFLWDDRSPIRDGALEMGIIIHEYTHGMSMRLVDPKAQRCLNQGKGQGLFEGWSEFMCYAMRVKKADTRDTHYLLAPYADPDGHIASFTIDRQKNNLSLDDLNYLTESHEQGKVWSSALFEVMWNLVDKYGMDNTLKPEFRAGDINQVPKDGRFLAMKLVIEGMKEIKCFTSILRARDAILKVDQDLNRGENHCLIYKAFASRGLGYDAKHPHMVIGPDGPFKNGFTIPGFCRSHPDIQPPRTTTSTTQLSRHIMLPRSVTTHLPEPPTKMPEIEGSCIWNRQTDRFYVYTRNFGYRNKHDCSGTLFRMIQDLFPLTVHEWKCHHSSPNKKGALAEFKVKPVKGVKLSPQDIIKYTELAIATAAVAWDNNWGNSDLKYYKMQCFQAVDQ